MERDSINESGIDINDKDFDKNRLSIIKDIFNTFTLLFSDKNFEDIPPNFEKEKKVCIDEIKKCFSSITYPEINYILYSFNFAKDKSVKNIINFLDTMNSILSHYEYYKIKNRKIKYNNSHFDNYILKRYECADIFTNYLRERGCRELKIDNKLYFNYIPIRCVIKKHTDIEKRKSIDPKIVEECPFAHNKMEEIYHPFVYKKFKCFIKKKCDDNCPLYHSNEDNIPIDMETEVDFDSYEMKNLSKVLSSLKLNKDDIKNDEQMELFLQKKARDTGDFLPTEFNPSTYKLYKCPLGKICKLDKKLCLNYHGNGDRRRNPNFYKAELCPNLYEKKKRKPDAECPLKDDCDCAHNIYEYYYHPDKFRTIQCPQEKSSKYCKERLICPYLHKTDSDCGKNGEKIILDEKLITDYYKSLMASYEKAIDNENEKLNEIEKKYLCYNCGERNTCALKKDDFLVDLKQNKIICERCANEKGISNTNRTADVGW